MAPTTDAVKQRTGLAIGSTGIAYAVWDDRRNGNPDIWFTSLPAGGSTWAANTKISDDPGTAAQTSPDIGVDTAGNLIAVWDDTRATPQQVRARHKPASGSWATSVIVAAADSREPAVAVRGDGQAYVAWHNGPFLIGSTQSVWGSGFDPTVGTWSAPEQLSQLASGTASGRASAALDGSRTIVLFDGGPQTPTYNPDFIARVRMAGAGSDAFTYGYDRLYRLTTVGNPGDDAAYGYDPVGNRLSKTLGTASTSYGYDRADRITTAGAMSITVNAVGATTARGADSFAYDQVNRLTSATVAGATETYTYDGDGVRFSRQVGAGPLTRYVTDPTAGLPVTIGDGTRKYVWGLGLAYAVNGSTLEVYHADRLGSIRAITDGLGTVTASYRSDEFGIPVSSSGSNAQPFRFTGEPLDATGLTYLRARYQDPTLGRFMTSDSWTGATSSPSSLNRYSYATANPTTYRDPSGKCVQFVFVSAVGGATVLVGVVVSGVCLLIGASILVVTAIYGATETVQVDIPDLKVPPPPSGTLQEPVPPPAPLSPPPRPVRCPPGVVCKLVVVIGAGGTILCYVNEVIDSAPEPKPEPGPPPESPQQGKSKVLQ